MRKIISILLLCIISLQVWATKYYVKNGGNDSSDGRSDATAWATLSKVNSSHAGGDTVYFKQGSVWRVTATTYLQVKSGTVSDRTAFLSYTDGGAGAGVRPKFLGSKQENSTSDWVNIGGNLWENTDATFNVQIGNIILNNEALCGIRILTSVADLNAQGKYFWDPTLYKVTMYSTSNPALFYTNIECAYYINPAIIHIGGNDNITIEGLDVRYGSRHGISASGVNQNITIRNNYISFIGGGRSGTLRLGNGIEFWGSPQNVLVEKNIVRNIYDSGVTNQYMSSSVDVNGFTVRNNIIDKCEMGVEFWMWNTTSGSVVNVYFQNNTFVDSGRGWGANQRNGNYHGDAIYFSYMDNISTLNNIYIRNNITYNSTRYGILLTSAWALTSALTCDYNLYYNNAYVGRAVYTNYPTLTDWRTGTPHGDHSVSGNPMFVSATNFDITATGAGVNAGVDVGYTTDFDGMSISGTPDIGAYEYNTTTGKYYVRNGGNDNANGLSDATAWANHPWMSGWTGPAKTLVPGDTVFLKRGSSWSAKITVAQSGTAGNPIVISTYGTSGKASIDGSVIPSAWTNEGGNIFSAPITTDAQTNVVVVENIQKPMGRYPDTGTNLTYSSGTTTTLYAPSLPSSPDFDGGEVVINKLDYVLDRYVISSHSGTSITYTNPYGFEDVSPAANRFFFIQNHLSTLTTTGEWYHNFSTGRIYYYGTPPSTFRVARRSNLIYSNGFDYITIEGLELSYSIGAAVNAVNSSNNFSVKNCEIRYAGQQGIYIQGTNSLVDGCIIGDVNGAGIHFTGGGPAIVTNNTIARVGLLPGQAYVGELTDGIYIGVVTSTIEDNYINGISYNGIHFSGGAANTTVRHNRINDICRVLDDGGGIYSAVSGAGTRLLEYNIITNIGTSAPADVTIPRGIYLDEVNSNFIVRYNTIAYGRDGGITVHKGYSNTIQNNVVFDCKYNLHFLASASGQVYGNSITGNQFVAKNADQRAFYYYNSSNDIPSMGTLNNNIYARPIDNDDVIYTRESTTGYVNRTLAGWKTYSGQDANSTVGELAVTNTSNLRLLINSTYNPIYYEAIGEPIVDIEGNVYPDGMDPGSIITVPPWSSIVVDVMGDVAEYTPPTTGKYYVKNGGSDSNSGLSDATAWAHHPWMAGWTGTAKTLTAGDTVFLKRGSVWNDKITVAQSGVENSPIVIASYGTGDQPKISGFVTVTGWTVHSGSVYKATLSAEVQTNMVTIDNINTGMGRWPDTGYRLFESYDNTAKTITDTQLSEETPFDWDGAEVAIRKNNWNIERSLVASHSGDVITYSNLDGTSNVIGNNYGYFIQNDLRTVTTTNEWYHDHSANTIYIYGNPAGKVVKAATKTRLIYNNGNDYISIFDIALEGSIDNLIDVTGTSVQFRIENCNLSFSGENGIMFTTTPNYCVVTGNTITDSQAAGIKLWGGTGNEITYNNINNSGMIVGMGYVAFRDCGIYSSGSSYLDITHNRILNSCGNGIIIDGNNCLIQYNYVENASMRTNDSGGIYVGSGAGNYSTIDHNIVYNIPGDGSGTPYASNPLARGIYLDDFASFTTVTNNIVHTATESAMMLHDANDNTIRYNILYNSRYGLYYLSSSTASIRRNLVDHNQFVALGATQYTVLAQAHSSSPGDIPNFGTINYNIYARPINQTTDQAHLRTYDAGTVNRTLSGWQSFTSHDANSTYNLGGAISSTDHIRLIFNETMEYKYFALSASMKGLDNTSYSGTISLAPFKGLVLLGPGTATVVAAPEGPEYPDEPDPVVLQNYSGRTVFDRELFVIDNGQIIKIE